MTAAASPRDIFRHHHAVLAVVHADHREQVLRNVAIAREAGVDGVFLNNHGIPPQRLLELHADAAAAHPGWWIGVQCLGWSPDEVFERIGDEVAGVWVDDARIRVGDPEQREAEAVAAARASARARPLYFGGLAPRREVTDSYPDAVIAARFVDVITIRSPGDGRAVDPAVLRAIERAAHRTPVAIASGITPENVAAYLPHADAFLVATGISRSFHELDAARVRALVDRVRAHPASRPPLPEARPWTDRDGVLPSDWAQERVYERPILASTLPELTGRISIWRGSGAALLRWGGLHEDLPFDALLAAADVHPDRRYAAAITTSADPVVDGFLRALHLRPTAEPTVPTTEAVPALRAFVDHERARWPRHLGEHLEHYLRRLYGELSEVRRRDRRFAHIDYDGFDSGPMDLGLGLLVQDGEIWLWSRLVHAHK